MRKYYLSLKRRFNYLLDRGIDLCDTVIADTSRQGPRQTLPYRLAVRVGDVLHFLKEFPRLTAWEFVGDGRRVIFVGEMGSDLEALNKLLFSGEVERRELARVALWDLSRQSQAWLDDGADLVICQVSRLFPYKLQAPVCFTMPIWVKMLLTLPDNLAEMLAGSGRQRIRQRLNRGLNHGFQWHFSKDEADLKLFYNRMYLPFITARHGSAADLLRYEEHRDRYFKPGGLVMVTLDDQPVAASLCCIEDGVCYGVELGVLDADPALLKKQANAVVAWYSITWAHQQGARQFDLGGTRALRSNGVYLYKREWGAQVTEWHQAQPQWIVLSNGDRPEAVDFFNRLGFVTRIRHRYYGVHLAAGQITPDSLEKQWRDWQEYGVDGVMVLAPGSASVLHPAPEAAPVPAAQTRAGADRPPEPSRSDSSPA